MHQALPRERRAQERRGGTHNRLHTTTGAAAANEGPRSRERHAPRGRHTQACMLCRTSQVQPTRAAADEPPLQLHTAAAGQGTKGGTQSEGCGRQAQVLPVSTTCQATKGCVPKGAWHAGKPPPCHAANRQSCLRLVCKRVPFTLLAHTKTCRDASAAPSAGQEQPGATHTRQTKQQTKGKCSLPVTVTGGTHGEGMQLTEAGLERPHS